MAVKIDQGKCFGEPVLSLKIEVVSAAEESVASCHNSEAARFYRDLGANRTSFPGTYRMSEAAQAVSASESTG
jgi:hypothetical protein